ncbi:MAG: R.Pab1 family restriction endonuclease [Melioribacter sp.]|nr:R.Pab1 family restriction endonuclease [Melioribacter sp.]
MKSYLVGLNNHDFLDSNSELTIERSHPIEKNILGINYYFTQVKYPLLIHKFKQYEILTEIIIKEKQYAVGVQPMLYFCFPITVLKSSNTIIGRCAETNETAEFIIEKNNIQIFLKILKIFGTLSFNHNSDIRTIIDRILR